MKTFRFLKNKVYISCIALCATIAGCSNVDNASKLYESDGGKAISESLDGINRFYVSEVSLSDITLRGINAILAEDPELSITWQDNALVLRANDEKLHTILFEENDEKLPYLWANASLTLLDEAFSASRKLRKSKVATQQTTLFIRGMLSGLDRFSKYADPTEAKHIQYERDGYEGIGIEFTTTLSGINVTGFIDDSPAREAGLIQGDVIEKIDDISLIGLGENEIKTLLQGPINSSVKITIERKITQINSHDLVITRRHVFPNTVKYDANLLYPRIQISSFSSHTAVRMAEAILRARDYSGDQLKGIILDLRGNPGGLLQEAIHSADLLLDHGVISKISGRNPLSRQIFEAEPGNVLGNTPLVVLIDGATASASEILAAALQDHQRAVVVGATSYGKGTIQNVLSLSNEGELRLTWARYIAPNNYHINDFGVLPNICTSTHENGIAAVLKTLRASPEQSRQEFNKLKRLQFNIGEKVALFRDACPWNGQRGNKQLGEDYDPDIEAAETLLSNLSLYEDALNLSYLQAGN
ncbi:MAG: S41 family peptidase [Alphaproteobacteria bacterium]|nr:S41 family peptidase [Alphaproteobacteria bacterium]